MKRAGKKTYEKVVVDHTTGEIIREEFVHKHDVEPDFIKLYVDCLCDFKGISKSLNPILLGLIKHMSYASVKDTTGGQILYLNAALKRNVAENCEVSVKRVEQAITDFVRSGIFARIATATYQVNPEMFGKGTWKDIKNIRAKFDFKEGTVEAEIIRNEEKDSVK